MSGACPDCGGVDMGGGVRAGHAPGCPRPQISSLGVARARARAIQLYASGNMGGLRYLPKDEPEVYRAPSSIGKYSGFVPMTWNPPKPVSL